MGSVIPLKKSANSAYLELKKSQIKEISENYNSIVIDYSKEKKLKTVAALIEIIKKNFPIELI